MRDAAPVLKRSIVNLAAEHGAEMDADALELEELCDFGPHVARRRPGRAGFSRPLGRDDRRLHLGFDLGDVVDDPGQASAVSGTMIGSHVEIHCLSKEDIARVVDELVRQGVVQRAEDAGLERAFIVSLAARMKPTQKLDFNQAVAEVSHAVDIAVQVVAEGSSGSSDQLVDEVLKRIAERTKANDPAGATREAEEGFAAGRRQKRRGGPALRPRASPYSKQR